MLRGVLNIPLWEKRITFLVAMLVASGKPATSLLTVLIIILTSWEHQAIYQIELMLSMWIKVQSENVYYTCNRQCILLEATLED